MEPTLQKKKVPVKYFKICHIFGIWKNEKLCGFSIFIFQKYNKIWSASLEHFIKHKPLISKEWTTFICTCILMHYFSISRTLCEMKVLTKLVPWFLINDRSTRGILVYNVCTLNWHSSCSMRTFQKNWPLTRE